MSNSVNTFLSDQINVDLPVNVLCSQLVVKVNALDAVFALSDDLPPGVHLVRKGNYLFLKGCATKTGVFVCIVDVYGTWPAVCSKSFVLAIAVN